MKYSSTLTTPTSTPTLTLNQANINYVESSNFLGVYIDRKLNWSTHITNLANRLNTAIYMMRVLKNKVDKNTLKMFYYAKIYSLLRYGIIFWGQGTGWENIFRLQKKAIRIINGRERESNGQLISFKPVFLKLGLLTLPSIYILETILFISRSQPKLKTYGDDEERCRTRNALIYKLPIHNLSSFEKNVYYAGPKFYNQLPQPLQQKKGTPSFNAELKQYLISRVLYKIDDL